MATSRDRSRSPRGDETGYPFKKWHALRIARDAKYKNAREEAEELLKNDTATAEHEYNLAMEKAEYEKAMETNHARYECKAICFTQSQSSN